jgi:hypothetical protein
MKGIWIVYESTCDARVNSFVGDEATEAANSRVKSDALTKARFTIIRNKIVPKTTVRCKESTARNLMALNGLLK